MVTLYTKFIQSAKYTKFSMGVAIFQVHDAVYLSFFSSKMSKFVHLTPLNIDLKPLYSSYYNDLI